MMESFLITFCVFLGPVCLSRLTTAATRVDGPNLSSIHCESKSWRCMQSRNIIRAPEGAESEEPQNYMVRALMGTRGSILKVCHPNAASFWLQSICGNSTLQECCAWKLASKAAPREYVCDASLESRDPKSRYKVWCQVMLPLQELTMAVKSCECSE